LLDALLEAWKVSGTHLVIDAIETEGGDARERLHRLFRLSSQSHGCLNQAIRAWSSTDQEVARALDAISSQRIQYVDGLFRELGFSPPEAAARARLAFLALIGHHALAENSAMRLINQSDFDIVFAVLVRR
jgi:hypothetical protein